MVLANTGRDQGVDLLRCVGLVLVVLAHVGPPAWLAQLRNFDVPLMVLVSGVSFGLSSRGEPYASYLWKRINRLVAPVWIFLTGYFLVWWAFGNAASAPSADLVFSSYLLLGGISYLWIIWVFLFVALVAPWVYRLNTRLPAHRQYLGLLLVAYIGYEFFLAVGQHYLQTVIGAFLNKTLFFLLPYTFLFGLALRMSRLCTAQLWALGGGAALVFIVMGGALYLQTGSFVPTQNFKYPPTAYYLSFALAVSVLLWALSARLVQWVGQAKLGALVQFMAQNSIWVYLWHIPMLDLVSVRWYWFVKYPLVLGASVMVTWVQVRWVEKWLLPRLEKPAKRKLLRTWLTG
jgi:peptidoglycan/LPS O-acetylase OafA/YrhL